MFAVPTSLPLPQCMFNVECVGWTGTEIGDNDTSDDIRDVDLTSLFGPIAVEPGIKPGDCIFLILDDRLTKCPGEAQQPPLLYQLVLDNQSHGAQGSPAKHMKKNYPAASAVVIRNAEDRTALADSVSG
ncbi:hypothetical protein EDD22DRAFT_949285 [Suillus occidentalis]|nr:hypothetical protein EDD22DRAFT_949285 [Suillus occidentalis]